MTSKNIDIDEAERFVSDLVGEYAWFVRLGESRILRLEFGEPHLTVHAPQGKTMPRETPRLLRRRIVVPSGRRSLFIEDGLWTVEAGGLKCGRDDMDPDKTMPCLEILSGQKVDLVRICRDTKALCMQFDLGGLLKVESHNDFAENSSWIMFCADGYNISQNLGDVFVIDKS